MLVFIGKNGYASIPLVPYVPTSTLKFINNTLGRILNAKNLVKISIFFIDNEKSITPCLKHKKQNDLPTSSILHS